MREKIAKNRKYILMVLAILILATLYVGMKYLMRPKYEPLPVVKLKDKETNKKKFAVMVQNGDSYEEYTSEDGKWPSEDDYEFKEAKCIDNNGSLVNNAVTFESGKVTLKTNKTVYCTLYFDLSIPRAPLEVLRKNDTNKVLSEDIVGGMYRFQGVATVEQEDRTHKVVDNNYICFGTNNKVDCTNKETGYDKYMYRIIGITEAGQLYLIKMKGIETNSSKTFGFGFCSPCSAGSYWTSVGSYLNSDGMSSGKFVNNQRYEYMVEGNPWYSIIENHTWKYGNIINISNNGKTIYNSENAWSSNNSAKIGLMYLHDYYLAYDNARNWYTDYDTSNWMHFVNNNNTTGASEEILIPNSRSTSCTYYCDGKCECAGTSVTAMPRSSVPKINSMELRSNDSSINAISTLSGSQSVPYVIQSSGRPYESTEDGLARPTFYLSSSTTIKSGKGYINDPYIIDIGENN